MTRAGIDLTRMTRAKLLLMLPLTMALLVAATGFFTLSMTERAYVMYGSAPGMRNLMAMLGLQIALISLIAAILGFGIAMGVTSPVREVVHKLEAVASGDLRGALDIHSTAELDTLAGAYNDAIKAINRYVFQSMTGAVITLNAEGIVIGSSPAAEAILDYREDELVGRRFSEVFTPARGARATLAAVEGAIARREPVSVDEVVIVAKDGRPIRIGISASYLRRGDRRPGGARSPGAVDLDEAVGVTIAFKDLTEIRRLRERLQQADQLIALGTVTAGVAHELRNPLASLQGLTELLGRDFAQDDPRHRYVKTMLDAIGRLNRLVEDLLLFSSPASAVNEPTDIATVIDNTVTLVRPGLGQRNVAIEVGRDGSGAAIVNGNPAHLEQALSNIVLNAVQATPDGGVVTVDVTATDTHVAVRVHNTGSYIPPDRLKQIFVPFFTTKPTGTGLGLPIARQIIAAHGGRLDVDSRADVGTTFLIELPLATSSVAA